MDYSQKTPPFLMGDIVHEIGTQANLLGVVVAIEEYTLKYYDASKRGPQYFIDVLWNVSPPRLFAFRDKDNERLTRGIPSGLLTRFV